MRINWDDSKSETLKRERGLSLEEAAQAINDQGCVAPRSDDPEQYAVIGFATGQLITLVFEYRQDDQGDFIWLVTYWKATKSEMKIYEEFRKR